MSKLIELLNICSGSVTITVNDHRDIYLNVAEYMVKEIIDSEYLIEDVGEEIYNEMIKTNTVIEIQAYPHTPNNFYKIYHYDIEKAIELMIACCKGHDKNITVKATYKFPNGNVATFNFNNEQIPELQGVYTHELEEKIKKYSDARTEWHGFGNHD